MTSSFGDLVDQDSDSENNNQLTHSVELERDIIDKMAAAITEEAMYKILEFSKDGEITLTLPQVSVLFGITALGMMDSILKISKTIPPSEEEMKKMPEPQNFITMRLDLVNMMIDVIADGINYQHSKNYVPGYKRKGMEAAIERDSEFFEPIDISKIIRPPMPYTRKTKQEEDLEQKQTANIKEEYDDPEKSTFIPP